MKSPFIRMNLFKISALVMTVFLSACAGSVNTNVLRFYEAPLAVSGTYEVVPINDEDAGPQFNHYADLISLKMSEIGFTPKDAEGNPDYRVEVRYQVETDPYWGTGFYWRNRLHFGVGLGFQPFGYYYGYSRFRNLAVAYPWGVGSSRRYSSPYYFYSHYNPFFYEMWDMEPPKHTRVLEVRIVSVNADAEDNKIVFEGRAESRGFVGNLDRIMPFLVESIFHQFPGNNGEMEAFTFKDSDIK